MIVGVNEELLAGLAELLATWDPARSRVGPLFQKMSPFMRLYNTYGNSYNEAIALMTKSKEKDDFRDFLSQCRGTQPLDVEALLIQPVQRIPRYRLLLEDLLKVSNAAVCVSVCLCGDQRCVLTCVRIEHATVACGS